MEFEYMKFPTQVKEVAREIKRACNNYKARTIGNNKLKEVIMHYAVKYPEKLFSGDDLNPTVKLILGKQRKELVNKILEDRGEIYVK